MAQILGGGEAPERAPERTPAPLSKTAEPEGPRDDSSQSSLSRAESDEDLADSYPETPAEGDLLGQFVEREVQLKTQEALVEKLQKEVEKYRSSDINIEQFNKEKQELTRKLNEALFKLEKQSHEHREEILGFESFKTSHQGVVDELAQAKARIEELEEREGEDGGNKSGALLAAKMAEGMASVNNFSVSFYFFNSFLFYFLIFLVLTPRFFFFNNAGPNCHERKRDESHAGEVWLHGCDQGDRGP